MAPPFSPNSRITTSHIRTLNYPSNPDPMNTNSLPFLSPHPHQGYSADPQLSDPRAVPPTPYTNPNFAGVQVVPQGTWFTSSQSRSEASSSTFSPSINFLPEDTHESASPASDGAPSNASLDSRTETNGPAESSSGFAFIALPNADPPKKRPRRKFEEIDRVYPCNWAGCAKAYGTLNHLNQHIQVHGHGPKRTPREFKDLKRTQRSMSRTPSNPEFRGTSSVPAIPPNATMPGPSRSAHPTGPEMDLYRPSHRDLPSIEIPAPFPSGSGVQSAVEPSNRSQQYYSSQGAPSSAPVEHRSPYDRRGHAPPNVSGPRHPYEHNQSLQPNIHVDETSHPFQPLTALHPRPDFHRVGRGSTSQETHGYRDENLSRVHAAQNPIPVSYQVSPQELWPRPLQQQETTRGMHRPSHADQRATHYPLMEVHGSVPHQVHGYGQSAPNDAAHQRYGYPSPHPSLPYDGVSPVPSLAPPQASGPNQYSHTSQEFQYPMDSRHASMDLWPQPRLAQGPSSSSPTPGASSRTGHFDPKSTLLTPFRQRDRQPPP
ncbi:uncharacterized protein EI90DRAFT_2051398 [Cantharellus anzutake]|uniref:uncharacterized protein n=1 Tax=Cantharellus anzutake TaxID=1750568 RepID=UPI00190391F0|nr:uncharacterized protein EI90DRAFT_2051398 [Cantharellus anzutake]KAF8340344.1 hypothetical protein EI90DRAFT_2051398 [Cantharellus anzutake]